MFGFLMGTLQKFKENEDEAKKSDKVHHLKNNYSTLRRESAVIVYFLFRSVGGQSLKRNWSKSVS
jgi:hypothetical protein